VLGWHLADCGAMCKTNLEAALPMVSSTTPHIERCLADPVPPSHHPTIQPPTHPTPKTPSNQTPLHTHAHTHLDARRPLLQRPPVLHRLVLKDPGVLQHHVRHLLRRHPPGLEVLDHAAQPRLGVEAEQDDGDGGHVADLVLLQADAGEVVDLVLLGGLGLGLARGWWSQVGGWVDQVGGWESATGDKAVVEMAGKERCAVNVLAQ